MEHGRQEAGAPPRGNCRPSTYRDACLILGLSASRYFDGHNPRPAFRHIRLSAPTSHIAVAPGSRLCGTTCLTMIPRVLRPSSTRVLTPRTGALLGARGIVAPAPEDAVGASKPAAAKLKKNVLEVSGPDAAKFLKGQMCKDVETLGGGYSGFLNASVSTLSLCAPSPSSLPRRKVMLRKAHSRATSLPPLAEVRSVWS